MRAPRRCLATSLVVAVLLALVGCETAPDRITPASGRARGGTDGAPAGANATGTSEAPEDLPPGFVDGVPVGGADGTTPPPGTEDLGPDTFDTGVERYFGRDPWNAIVTAAAATSRSCTIANDDLVAMSVAPVFKESSAATTPATAPAPMTLSRYDEWSGITGTNTNANANATLYAFQDPYTAYSRAFWHPGIGIWQYDTAGVGAPFTAIERMDVSIVAADVTAGMASRYCNPASYAGHAAPFTDLERRNAAWAPWGLPCTLCEQLFQDLIGTTPHFDLVTLVDGISTTGGAQKRTCTLAGVVGTIDCWYVNPSVGVIEGATGWATLDPTGGSPTVAPTPLAKPFYVIDRGATEERHWLRADTGYTIDISGSRQIGKNDRVRSNQPGSGVTWSASSSLCDLTALRGSCLPTPPASVTATPQTIDGTFKAVPLDVQGDGLGDVLLYGTGSAPDQLLLGQGGGSFATAPITVNGSYDDVLVFDGNGDGADDVVWYAPSTGRTFIWWSDGDGTFTTQQLPSAAGARPLVGRFSGDGGAGADDLFLYGPGTLPDTMYSFGTVGSVRTVPISGTYKPFVADLDGDGFDDVFWYAPGKSADYIWYFDRGAHRSVSRSVSGTYWPLVGDFDGDGIEDITWYRAGTTPDSTWFGTSNRTFVNTSTPVDGTFVPVVVDLEGDGRDDILWYRAGGAADVWWRWTDQRARSSAGIGLIGTQQAVPGPYGPSGVEGLLWYGPGATPDVLWWHAPAS